MADVNINAGNISSVNLRQQGSNPTAPANGIKLFEKASGIYFVDSNSVVSGPLGAMFTPGGRLSMQSGTAVTTTDMHSGTSLWYNPHIHDMLSLWDGSKIVPVQFAPTAISLAGLSGTSSFDVFTYLNSGVPAYETSMWTSPTVRAVDISMQNGRKCKVGDATRLYLGSFYTSSGGQTDDSVIKRNVWNRYNQKIRPVYKADITGSWTYETTSWRNANNSAANRIEYTCGLIGEGGLVMSACCAVGIDSGISVGVSIAENGTAPHASTDREYATNYNSAAAVTYSMASAGLCLSGATGFNYYQWVELGGNSSGTTTFYGEVTGRKANISGYVMG